MTVPTVATVRILALMRGWGTRPTVWVVAGVVVLLAGTGSGAMVSQLLNRPGHHAAARPAMTLPASAPAATPNPTRNSWWQPLPAAVGAFVPVEIVIERFHVEAPIEIKGIDNHNTMESPDLPTDVAWYPFTSKPGAGTNSVFAGHRDFGRVGNPAVFWDLDKLEPGDLIDVVSGRQTQIRYRVSQTWDYQLSTIPMAQVLAPDPNDEVTLITCAGTFARGGYDHRYVVRAVKTTV